MLRSPGYYSRQQSSRCISDVKEKKHYKEIPDAHLQKIENLKKSKGIVKNSASNRDKMHGTIKVN